MKKILLAAGIGLTLMTASMAKSSENYVTTQSQNTTKDTVPEKDTTQPKKDSSAFVLRFQ